MRAAREAYARRFDFDLRATCRDLREKQRAGGREVVLFPPRRPEQGEYEDATDRRGA